MGSIAKYRKRQLAFLTAALMTAAWMPTAWAEVAPETLPKYDATEYGVVKPVTNGKQLNIKIGGDGKGIIKWKSFDVGKDATVNFSGEKSGWMVLNRIYGDRASEIYGKINGRDGTVFLVNPDGITFGAGAYVDVGSLVASTMSFSWEKFKQGVFETDNQRYIDGAAIKIEDKATINASDGYVAIFAPEIYNHGTITAKDVAMGYGNKVSLSYADKIEIKIDVSGNVIDTGNEKGVLIDVNKINKLVADSLIKNDGTIEATGVKKDADGNVTLVAAKVELAAPKVEPGSDISTSGVISTGNLNIAARDISMTKDIFAGRDILMAANSVTAEKIEAGGDISLSAADKITANGTVNAAGYVTLSAVNKLTAEKDIVAANGNIDVVSKNITVKGNASAAGYINMLAADVPDGKDIFTADKKIVADNIEVDGNIKSGADVNLAAEKLTTGEAIEAKGEIKLKSNAINIDKNISVAGDINLSAPDVTIAKDKGITSAGNINLTADRMIVNGNLSAKGNIDTTASESLQVRDSANVHAHSDVGAGTWNINAKNVIITENQNGEKDTETPNRVSNKVLSSTLDDTNVNIVVSPEVDVYYSDIKVEKPIEKKEGEADTSLSLIAGHNISVDADIKSMAGKLNIFLASDVDKTLADVDPKLATNSIRKDGANIIRANIETNGGDFETYGLHSTEQGEDGLANGTYFGVNKIEDAGKDRHIYTNGGNIKLGGAEVLLGTGGTVVLDTSKKDSSGAVVEGGSGTVIIDGTVNSANYYDMFAPELKSGTDDEVATKQTSWEKARNEAKGKGETSHLAVITSALEDAIVSSTTPMNFNYSQEAYAGGHVVAVVTQKGYGVYNGTVVNTDNGFTITETKDTEGKNHIEVVAPDGTSFCYNDKNETSYVVDEKGKVVQDSSGVPTVRFENGDIKTVINDTKDQSEINGGWYKLYDENGNFTGYARYWAWTEGDEKGKIFYVQTTGENIVGDKDIYNNSLTPEQKAEVQAWLDKDHGVKKMYANFAKGEPNDDKGGGKGAQTALAVAFDTYMKPERGKVLRAQWDDVNDEVVKSERKRVINYAVETDLTPSSLTIRAGETTLNKAVGNLTRLGNVDIEAFNDSQGKNDITINGSVEVRGKVEAKAEGNITTADFIKAANQEWSKDENKLLDKYEEANKVSLEAGKDIKIWNPENKTESDAVIANTINLTAGNDVTLNNALTAKAKGDGSAIKIIAQKRFLNEAVDGVHVLKVDEANGSHWKVYSNTPYDDKFGGLNSEEFAGWGWGNDQTPTYIPIDGNRYIFKINPVITYMADSADSREEGTSIAPVGYTIKYYLDEDHELDGRYQDAFLDGYNLLLMNRKGMKDVTVSADKDIKGRTYDGFSAEAKAGEYDIVVKFKDGVKAGENYGYEVKSETGRLTITSKYKPKDETGDKPKDETGGKPEVEIETPGNKVENPKVVITENIVTSTVDPIIPVEKPLLTPISTTILSGTASIAENQDKPGSVDRVLGLQSAELPVFNEKHGKVELYGTYDVTVDPDKVKMKPTAKVLPEPDQPKNQYREYERELTTSKGAGRFRLTYNGSTFDIYPADAEAAAILAAGDGTKNVEVESQALFAAFNEMGITLDDLNGVYTHFEKKQ